MLFLSVSLGDLELPFPKCERIIYSNNPLEKVICQLRFPPILKIVSELPACFQGKIRADFPNFLEKEELALSMPKAIRNNMPPEMLRQIAPQGTKNYEFSSEDDNIKVNLTQTFLAFSTTQYKQWEKFGINLKKSLKALNEVYKPSYFTRIGLRYINVIKPTILGMKNVKWNDLLKPHVLGMLVENCMHDRVKSVEAKYEILLEDNSSIAKIILMLIKEKDESSFVIDTDLFNETRAEIDEIDEKLNYLHDRAYRLIRWCITKRLHEALEPTPL